MTSPAAPSKAPSFLTELLNPPYTRQLLTCAWRGYPHTLLNHATLLKKIVPCLKPQRWVIGSNLGLRKSKFSHLTVGLWPMQATKSCRGVVILSNYEYAYDLCYISKVIVSGGSNCTQMEWQPRISLIGRQRSCTRILETTVPGPRQKERGVEQTDQGKRPVP